MMTPEQEERRVKLEADVGARTSQTQKPPGIPAKAGTQRLFVLATR